MADRTNNRPNWSSFAMFLCLLPMWGLVACGSPPAIELGAGVTYEHRLSAAPLSVHIVRVDLTQPDLLIDATVGQGVRGSESVAAMAERQPTRGGRVFAAINGDFFEYKTEPRYLGTMQGMTVVDGELVTAPGGHTFWIDAGRQPHIGRTQSNFTVTWPDEKRTSIGLNCSTSDYRSEVRTAGVVLYTPAFGSTTSTEASREMVLEPLNGPSFAPLRVDETIQARVSAVQNRGNTAIPTGGMVLSISRKADALTPHAKVGDVLTIRTAVTPDMKAVQAAIGGDPVLVANSEIAEDLNDTQPHPRTAVGFAGMTVYMVVVDGRQPRLSIGVTRGEMARIMLDLGCTDALSLDGGGSTTMWVGGRVVSSPSSGSLRPVGNALMVVRRPVSEAN